jgi:hypothetical protein
LTASPISKLKAFNLDGRLKVTNATPGTCAVSTNNSPHELVPKQARPGDGEVSNLPILAQGRNGEPLRPATLTATLIDDGSVRLDFNFLQSQWYCRW